MGSQCFATNELVGDQGSAAPPASRKSLSQALDEAVSCSEKRRLWLELQHGGPGSMDSVPRRGSSTATCTSTTTLDLPLLSPAIRQPAHPRAHRSPRLPGNFSCGTHTGAAHILLSRGFHFCWGGPRWSHRTTVKWQLLSKMLDYQSVKSLKLILTGRKAPRPISINV